MNLSYKDSLYKNERWKNKKILEQESGWMCVLWYAPSCEKREAIFIDGDEGDVNDEGVWDDGGEGDGNDEEVWDDGGEGDDNDGDEGDDNDGECGMMVVKVMVMMRKCEMMVREFLKEEGGGFYNIKLLNCFD